MSKQTRREKKEEERRIIAEMESAMRETQAQKNSPPSDGQSKPRGRYGKDPTPETLHCKRCKTVMENGVCPTCGYKIYVPMDEAKRKKIRFIAAGVCIAVFLVLFILLQLK